MDELAPLPFANGVDVALPSTSRSYESEICCNGLVLKGKNDSKVAKLERGVS